MSCKGFVFKKSHEVTSESCNQRTSRRVLVANVAAAKENLLDLNVCIQQTLSFKAIYVFHHYAGSRTHDLCATNATLHQLSCGNTLDIPAHVVIPKPCFKRLRFFLLTLFIFRRGPEKVSLMLLCLMLTV